LNCSTLYAIYGYFAAAITRAFYPSGSMYGTYAAFGAAFLMRPVGAIVIGAYGDRMGRRAALVVTIWLMAGATGGAHPNLPFHWLPGARLAGALPPAARFFDWRRMGRGSGIPH
jgi:MFS family permease